MAHGFGGGGHNGYLNVVDYFTKNGYLVFTYDATGNDESEGAAVGGLPQGLIDVDYALRFVKSENAYWRVFFCAAYGNVGGEVKVKLLIDRSWKRAYRHCAVWML